MSPQLMLGTGAPGDRQTAGWNTWVTFSISPMAPTSTVTRTRRVVDEITAREAHPELSANVLTSFRPEKNRRRN
jgi:hypothetical protein